MRLTAKSVAEFTPPQGKNDHPEYDDEIPGFGARWRRSKSGAWGKPRAFLEYTIGSKNRKIQLGRLTEESFLTRKDHTGKIIKLGIREQVIQLRAKVTLGHDPSHDKAQGQQRAAEIVLPIAKKFLAVKEGELRPGSLRHVKRHILKYARPIHGLQLGAVDRRRAAALISEIMESNGKVAANRAGSTLFGFYAWAMEQGLVDANPFAGLSKYGEKPRERVLNDDELRWIWIEAGDDQYGSIVKLLMLSGQRADEMASLRRSEIKKVTVPMSRINGIVLPAFDVIAAELPGDRTKNKRPHVVPLTKPALAIIQTQPLRKDEDGIMRDLLFGVGQGGFSGWSRCKERLDERIQAARLKAWEKAGAREDKPPPLPHWTPHDLRRTMDTAMNDRLGIAPHVVEAILNHVSSHKSGKSGVAGIYNKALYLRERTEALRLWADHIMAIVGDASANARPLQQAAE